VLENTAHLHRTETTSPEGDTSVARRVYDYLGKIDESIPLGEDQVSFKPVRDGIVVTFHVSGRSLMISTAGVDYIITIDAISMTLDAEDGKSLAVLATGRATGNRDLLAVISEKQDLIYLELLDRFWDFRDIPLAITRTVRGDAILVGSDPNRLLAFAPL